MTQDPSRKPITTGSFAAHDYDDLGRIEPGFSQEASPVQGTTVQASVAVQAPVPSPHVTQPHSEDIGHGAAPNQAHPAQMTNQLDFINGKRDAQAFAKAKRHSGLVGVLKVVLPVIGVAVLGVFAGALIFKEEAPEVTIENTTITDGKLVMENPVMNGVDGQKRPYNLTAARAIQDAASPNTVALEGIDARIAVQEGNFANITAGTGLYDTNAKSLQLGESVNVVTDDGMEINMLDADIDIDKGMIRTQSPVEIKTAGADITSNGLIVEESGERIIFDQKVRMTIRPGKLPTAETGNTDPVKQEN